MGFDWDNQPVSEYELLNGDVEEFDDEAEYEYEDEYEDVAEELLESVTESSAFDLNNKEASAIYSARLRLEQARLYELLINHNVFDGVDASPEAITKVQSDLKKYLVDRLEILLGIKKKKKKEIDIQQAVVVDSQFNDIEVDFLKALAYKGTKGASSGGMPVQTTQKPQINTIKQEAPTLAQKPQLAKITPVQKPKPITKREVKKVTKKTVKRVVNEAPEEALKPTKKVAKKKKSTKKKNKKKLSFKTGIKARNLTDEEIKAIAIAEIKEERALTGGKDAYELDDNEKEELMRKRSGKHHLPRPKEALPPPTEIEEHSYATQHSNSVTGVGKLSDMIAASIAAPTKE